jgi:hypothetical protein
MTHDAQQRLVNNIADSLAQVSRDDIIARSIEHFRKADADLGRRITEGVAARQAKGGCGRRPMTASRGGHQHGRPLDYASTERSWPRRLVG